MKVLTTIPGSPHGYWGVRTVTASKKCSSLLYDKMNTSKKYFISFFVALSMVFMRSNYDVVVVDGGPVGQFFSWFQSIIFFGKKPTLMIDCLWYVDNRRCFQLLKKLHKKLSSMSVDRFLVWAEHEVSDYSNEFDIAKSKFYYVPFHVTLEGYKFQISDDNFIFSGGNGDRDYVTLIEAVRGTSLPLFIAATDMSLFSDIIVPPNVTIQGVSHQKFRELLASCTVSVVPMRDGLLHSGGQQTFLNSMFLCKPTVVVGERVADGYIKNGINGYVVGYRDVNRLRKILLQLWNSKELRDKLGQSGYEFASTRTTLAFMQDIYRHAEEVCRQSKNKL